MVNGAEARPLLVIEFEESDQRIVFPGQAGVGIDMIEDRLGAIAEMRALPIAAEVKHQAVLIAVLKKLLGVLGVVVEPKGKDDDVGVDAFFFELGEDVIPAVEFFGVDGHVAGGVLTEPLVKEAMDAEETVALPSGGLGEGGHLPFEFGVVLLVPD